MRQPSRQREILQPSPPHRRPLRHPCCLLPSLRLPHPSNPLQKTPHPTNLPLPSPPFRNRRPPCYSLRTSPPHSLRLPQRSLFRKILYRNLHSTPWSHCARGCVFCCGR